MEVSNFRSILCFFPLFLLIGVIHSGASICFFQRPLNKNIIVFAQRKFKCNFASEIYV